MVTQWIRRSGERYGCEYFENITFGQSQMQDVVELPSQYRNPEFDPNLNSYRFISFKRDSHGGETIHYVQLSALQDANRWMRVAEEDYDAIRAAIAERLVEEDNDSSSE